MERIRRALRGVGVDRAIGYGALGSIRTFLSGPITALLIVSYFSPDVQGYFYTFGSLLALQVFVELGLGQVIMQFASHEWAHLHFDEERRIQGDAVALSRLVSLGRASAKYYLLASVVLAASLGVGGYAFFVHSPRVGVHWVAPWLALCLVTAVRLWLVPIWSLLEGCNQVAQVYGYRLLEGLVTTVATWLAIGLGLDLWVPAVSTLAGLLAAAVFLRRYTNSISIFISAPSNGPQIGWRSEVWPLQWRIALSWVSGYFAFSLFTPVLFHYHGPVLAGQMGMTWSIVSAVSSVASSFVFTKAPLMGSLVARREWTALDQLHRRVTVASFLVGCLGGVCVWGGLALLYLWHSPLSTRMLPMLPTGLLLITTALMQISFGQSVYLRAHKKEPFLVLSMVSGVLIGASVWVLGQWYGAEGEAAAYLGVTAIVGLPTGTWVFLRCRKKWHVEP